MKSVDFINKTLEIMLNRYGPFMTVHEYAEVMKLQPDTVYKQIADGTVDVGTIENPNRRKQSRSRPGSTATSPGWCRWEGPRAAGWARSSSGVSSP